MGDAEFARLLDTRAASAGPGRRGGGGGGARAAARIVPFDSFVRALRGRMTSTARPRTAARSSRAARLHFRVARLQSAASISGFERLDEDAVLEAFLEKLEEKYGSISDAFRAMDTDGDGRTRRASCARGSGRASR